MAYRFDIQYKPTKDHGNADGPSRLSSEIDAEFDCFESRENTELFCNIEKAIGGFPITHDLVRSETLRDPTFKSISLYVQHNSWPKPTRLNNDLISIFNLKILCVLKTMLVCCNVKVSLELLFLTHCVKTFYVCFMKPTEEPLERSK